VSEESTSPRKLNARRKVRIIWNTDTNGQTKLGRQPAQLRSKTCVHLRCLHWPRVCVLGNQLDSPCLEFSAGDDFPCSTLQVVKVPHRLAGDVDASPETDEEYRCNY
jgi:hypothetical protein